jgi:hypothetical protein
MRICLRFHMPGIFDSGWAPKVIEALRRQGEVEAVVTGTTGTTAMIDAGMEGEVKALPMKWSEWLLAKKKVPDFAVTASHSVDLERPRAECFHISKKFPGLMLVGVDTNCRVVIPWVRGTEGFAARLAKDLGFGMGKRHDYGKTYWEDGDLEYRRVLAVSPGDWLLIDYIVVGKVVSDEVVVVAQDGEVTGMRGVSVKENGLEKLGRVSLRDAKIDSVKTLRGAVPRRRGTTVPKGEKVAFINHSGYGVYELLKLGLAGAVAVGDDTTAIAGDILGRYRVPVVGITDGDPDGLLPGELLYPGSMNLRVLRDDDFGKVVLEEVFGGSQVIEGDFEEIKWMVAELSHSRRQLRYIVYP